jgi:CBS domain-containing protein
VTTTPATPIPEALELLHAAAEPRVIVLADDGATLVGLLCFNRGSDAFCTA